MCEVVKMCSYWLVSTISRTLMFTLCFKEYLADITQPIRTFYHKDKIRHITCNDIIKKF